MDFHENELIGLVLYVGLWLFVACNYNRLKAIPRLPNLLAAWAFLSLGSFFTNLEGFFSVDSGAYWGCNLVEHLCYAAGAAILALWCLRAPHRPGAVT
ncbi:MAG: hypothetical protein JW810_08690 [Sedimentisphaerales bacterium]|nr:hypothetical protein [Sedimentisphaerales bacterium]